MKNTSNLKLSDMKHSKKAQIGTLIGTIAFLFQIAAMFIIALSEEDIMGIAFGVIGFLCAIGTLVGLIISIIGFTEKDTYRIFPIIGTIINFFMLLFYISLIILGLV